MSSWAERFSPPACGQGQVKLALNWLCFSAVPGGIYFHNPPFQKTLRLYWLPQIGFVFS
jgi:hypothetical protein